MTDRRTVLTILNSDDEKQGFSKNVNNFAENHSSPSSSL
jgi:hypothetical protein